MKAIIYHNPKWGKSRDSVRILEKKKKEFTVIEYLKNPLSKKDLIHVINILDLKASDIVRTTEKEFKENNLLEIMGDEDKILDAIEKFPKIMQRPIIIHGNKGVIGRPPENINKIL